MYSASFERLASDDHILFVAIDLSHRPDLVQYITVLFDLPDHRSFTWYLER